MYLEATGNIEYDLDSDLDFNLDSDLDFDLNFDLGFQASSLMTELYRCDLNEDVWTQQELSKVSFFYGYPREPELQHL